MTVKLTREEAIQDLKAIKSFERYARGRLALDIAIEALEREPSEDEPQDDLISRAEAIETIEIVDWYHQNSNKDMVHGANDNEHQAWYKAQDIYKALETIPSADRPRPIDPTCAVDPESGVVPRSACEPKLPKTIIYADRPRDEFDGMIFSTDKYMAFIDKKEIHIMRKDAHKVTIERTFNTKEDEE